MILNRLRLETRSDHDKLDHHPLMEVLMSPGLTLPHYQDLLGKFLGFYQPLEPILGRFKHWSLLGIDLDERRKTPWLLQDLACLKVKAADFPLCSEPDWILDEASALGTFYVMEGSTLGGQVISRHVAAQLGLSREHGLAFFSSYGEAVGARWRETREALLRFAEQTASEDAMIHAAQRTFRALASWLDQENSSQKQPGNSMQFCTGI